ncbi:PQQ-dependent sugar dehydrogenase [Phycisphaera mikurensis]|uniref:Putative soluble aldose sugar dehydrogenase n=1 Tax=Phycisphaera mikurensis (strain NBRC 102666 / KCTC 22515 / FYK2301M01) TaxID=1142394 RepID=I0IBG1_PHYMF|nr:PQQ-dependent sugar dehydrogenase [Phycisphaera mikurensis]MBB6442868.1 glucose/arabinose dehydrogenase [Phycisphaera mikurensis]BAM02599.1 putative soluble aldose sugar dehydrogenase [Phycisphaera mikurensis NBRC 102666]
MLRLPAAASALLLAATPAAAQSTAAKIWEQNCASCHGADGAGNSASSLLDDDWETDGTDRGLYASIDDGLKHLGMPAYGGALTPAEIWSQVVYLRELREDAERAENPAAVAKPGTGGVKEGTGVYATDRATFRLEEVPVNAATLERPWAIDFLPDGRVLLTERAGALLVVPAGGGDAVRVAGTPRVWEHGQGGLLDVALDPAYRDNGWVYLSFSTSSGERDGRAVGNTAFVRGRIAGDGSGGLRWEDQQLVHRPDEADDGPQGVHFGSRFAFDGDGHVFVALGERGRNELSLETDTAFGKVLRLDEDGSVPADGQPFADDPAAVRGLWTLGHRNPQALLFQPGSGRLYGIEHGPRGGDEINLIEPGRSYGWSRYSYSINYNGTPRGRNAPWHAEAGETEPVFTWTPSIAPCGAAFYDADAFPGWRGDLFVTSLVKQELHRIRLSKDGRSVAEQEVLLRGIGRLRDVATGPDGALWIAAEKPGRVFRVVPAS